MTPIRTNIEVGDTVTLIDYPELVGVVEVMADSESLVMVDGEISVFPTYFLEKTGRQPVVRQKPALKKVVREEPKSRRAVGYCKKCHNAFDESGHVTSEYVERCLRNGWTMDFGGTCFVCSKN